MIINAIRDYLRTCPLLDNNRINVDFLGKEAVEYSIEPTPTDPVIRTYADGGTLRQYLFVFASREWYGPDVRMMLDNSGFFEAFADWIEEQSMRGNLPVLSGRRKSRSLEVLSSGYLFENTTNDAKYQIQLRLVYYQDFMRKG